MAQLIKRLPCKQERMGSILRHHGNKGRSRLISGDDGQPAALACVVSSRSVLKKKKRKGRQCPRDNTCLRSPSDLHIHPQSQCVHINTHKRHGPNLSFILYLVEESAGVFPGVVLGSHPRSVPPTTPHEFLLLHLSA